MIVQDYWSQTLCMDIISFAHCWEIATGIGADKHAGIKAP